MSRPQDHFVDISTLSATELNSELALACSGRSSFSPRQLLAAGACANAIDSSGSPALLIAAWDGRASAIEALLAHGADPRQCNHLGMTPLMAAARSGSAPCAALLLEGSNPLASDNFGLTALMAASSAQSADCCALLAPCSNPMAISHMGSTACCMAAANGALACFKILMPSPRDARRKKELGDAFVFARSSGHEEIACLAAAALLSMDDFAGLAGQCPPTPMSSREAVQRL